MSNPQFNKGKDTPLPLSEVQKAWLAGWLEGEGYFCCLPNSSLFTVRGTSTDPDVIQTLADMTGVGKCRVYRRPNKNPNHKDICIWDVSNRGHVLYILEAIQPYMHTRRSAKIRELVSEIEKHEERVRMGKRRHQNRPRIAAPEP